MKKIVSSALVLLLLLSISTALAGSAGTAADPFISLSYINDTFSPSVKSEAEPVIDSSLDSVYDLSASKLESIYASYEMRFGAPEGYTFSDGWTDLDMAAGSAVNLVFGGSFMLSSGSVSVKAETGTVIDLSDGSEIVSGGSLKKNVRYLCAENTAASFTAVSGSSVLVDGYYKIYGTVRSPLGFNDVSASQWFYDAVAFVFDKGFMTGISSSEFGVSLKTTRAVFVTSLYRMAGQPMISGKSIFSDVADDALYYYYPVIWSNQNGIILGHDDGTFRPNDSITREQMAAIMYRFVKYSGIDVSNTDPSVFNSFPDCAQVNAYASDSMKWATANGIINGMDGTLNPGGTAIRAQVAQIIRNFYECLI